MIGRSMWTIGLDSLLFCFSLKGLWLLWFETDGVLLHYFLIMVVQRTEASPDILPNAPERSSSVCIEGL